MDVKEFRKRAKEMVDYVADYLENIRDRPVLPSVEPGYLRQMIPAEAPQQPEKWEQLFADIERVIMPGITQWQSPRFFAYFPANNSYVATIADILSDSIGCIGFSWAASPACTELESVMMDWLGQMLQLPDEFLFTKSTTHGGGVIQGTASEATLVALLAARVRATAQVRAEHPDWDEHYIFSRLIMYASDQSHSSVERAALLCNVKYRALESHAETFALCGVTLDRAIKKDRDDGLIPFFVVATLGTTPSCAFDNLIDVGPTCALENVWLHVDAAYAGTAFVCPEYRHFLNGIEFADSFNFNPHKWMLVNFDCSALWFKDSRHVVDAFNVDPLYLKHDMQGLVPDYRHWQIPLGRRFRSLKIWFVLRMYGVEGIQEHVRKHCQLAQQLAALMQADERFEIVAPVHLSLVCFRLRHQPNQVSEALLKQINKNAKIHLVPSMLKGKYMLRMAIVSAKTELRDVEFAWQAVKEATEQVLAALPASSSMYSAAVVKNGLAALPPDETKKM